MGKTILQIPRQITVPDLDDFIEVQSATLGSAGLDFAALGVILAKGTFTLTSATATLLTISLGGTLPAVPSNFRLTFNGESVGGGGSGNIIFGNVVSDTVTDTQFQVQLLGPPGDTTHTLYWEALL